MSTPRPYHSPTRDEQARSTRRAIIAAATRLFAERGYPAVTMKDIASAAGVSVQSVYLAGSKVELLKVALDQAVAGDDESVAIADRPDVRTIYAERDPATFARLVAQQFVPSAARAAPLWNALVAAAATDDELAALREEFLRQGVVESRRLAEAAAGLDGFAPGVDPRDLADTFYALLGPDIYLRLARERGWNTTRYTRWLEATIRALVAVSAMPPPATAP